MGDALVKLAKMFVPGYPRVVDGKVQHVDGYWREAGDIDPASAVDFQDYRKDKSIPLKIDKKALSKAMEAVGIKTTPNTKIRLRLWSASSKHGTYGQTQQIGPDEYRVVVRVLSGKGTKDSHFYVMNNSLLHELRHVTQMQSDPNHQANYVMQNMTVGYSDNVYEIDGRYYGRLADHTGTKDPGPAGTALGKQVWGIVPG
jgi:hypothetical protein